MQHFYFTLVAFDAKAVVICLMQVHTTFHF